MTYARLQHSSLRGAFCRLFLCAVCLARMSQSIWCVCLLRKWFKFRVRQSQKGRSDFSQVRKMNHLVKVWLQRVQEAPFCPHFPTGGSQCTFCPYLSLQAVQ
ncbi:hypothetical protein HMPREF9069_00480 [Atopobium sp. oral taxon 810 str. F0209]|nr:hypothetical protein HMPREF9069_00480 [Atopobium sp. oral taxon 810 str. F0209]